MRICKVKGCEREHKAKGYCNTHYEQIRRRGRIFVMEPKKKCVVDGCDNIQRGRESYCIRHRSQMRRCGKILNITTRDRNKIIIKESHAEIILRNSKNEEVAIGLIDVEDVERISNYKWALNNGGYLVNVRNNLRLHRFLVNPKNKIVDHINRNPLDNRKENLRICDQSINVFNSKLNSRNSSGVVGVAFDKNAKKWTAYIHKKRKRINLGLFKNFNDAVEVRKKAELKYFGEVPIR